MRILSPVPSSVLMRYRLAFLTLLLAVAGCTSPDRQGEAATDPPAAVPTETRTDTLWIEGIPEPMTVQEYAVEGGFPLPFRTDVPADWYVETVSSGEGDAVRFTPPAPAAEEAVVIFAVHPPGQSREEALRQAERAAGDVAREDGEATAVWEEPSEPWALAEAVYGGGRLAGGVMVGEHAGQFFHFSTRYPVEMGDGMAPRIRLILDTWRWQDTGGGL